MFKRSEVHAAPSHVDMTKLTPAATPGSAWHVSAAKLSDEGASDKGQPKPPCLEKSSFKQARCWSFESQDQLATRQSHLQRRCRFSSVPLLTHPTCLQQSVDLSSCLSCMLVATLHRLAC